MRQAIALLLLCVAGCAFLNPNGQTEDKLAAVEKTYTATMQSLASLRRQGHVATPDWQVIKEISETCDAAFESVHADLDAGRKIDLDAALRGIRASLERLQNYESEAKRERGNPVSAADDPRPAGDAGQGQVFARAA